MLRTLAGDPSGCVDSDRRVTHQRRQRRLQASEFGRSNLVRPLVAEALENGFALGHHIEPEVRHLQPLAPRIAGVGRADHVPPLDQHRDRLGRSLLGDGCSPAKIGSAVGARGNRAKGELVDGFEVVVAARRQLGPRGVDQRTVAAEEQQGEIGSGAGHGASVRLQLALDNLVVYCYRQPGCRSKEFLVPTIPPAGATIPGVTHHVARLNGTELHYVSAGTSGSPILLVHGFPETWWAFQQLIPLLATHHRVYAIDLCGFGDSGLADESYSSSIAADDLHALIGHLSVGPVHLVGQDVSGGVVYRLAATHPDDVASLTAIESGLAGFGAERLADVTNGGVWYVGALAAPAVAALLFEKQARSFIGDYLYPLYGVPASAVTPDDVAEYARTYGRPGGFSGAAGLYRGMISEGHELEALAETLPLRVPVTTIGSRSGGFTHATFSSVTKQDVTSIQLDGVGHYVAQESPQLLANTLLEAFGHGD
jgi:pimeloyl-ACP methyl ester carboxylesterase